MTDKKTDIISDENTPPEQLSAWARWQLPNMDVGLPQKGNALNIKAPSKNKITQPLQTPEPELKPPTAQEIEAIRQAAFEEGKEEGRQAGHVEGYKAGYAKGESDVKAAVTRLGQIARVLLEPIPANDEELEGALLSLVESICKRVVQRELKLDSSGLKKIVTTALESLNSGGQRIRIHLNPVDLEVISEHLNEQPNMDGNWRVLPHPTITPGGCIIETDNSLVDARAEKRLAAVIQQVFEQQQAALEQSSLQQRGMDQLLEEVEAFPVDEQPLQNDDLNSQLDADFHAPDA